MDVVGSVSDGRALVSEAERLRPDVVVLYVGMPVLNGIEAAPQIKGAVPTAGLVFLSQQSGKEYVKAAFRLGAWAYVLKSAAAVELVKAILDATRGARCLSAELRQRFGDPDALADANSDKVLVSLTPPQRSVLILVPEGKSAQEAASILGISVKTVQFHTAALMDELGLRTTSELARYATETV